jgi:osmotically-inducible protein OsmY
MNRCTRAILAVLLLPAVLHVTGCAVAAGAGIATGAVAITDRRTAGTFIDDQLIEVKVSDSLRTQEELWKQSHVNATSFNNIVLLSGETPSEANKSRIGQIAANVQKVRQVHNELAIAAPSSLVARSSDTWVTGKVKTSLLGEMQLDATRVKVVTEQGVVYLMGLVTSAEADLATELARRVGGVQRVVRLFEVTN